MDCLLTDDRTEASLRPTYHNILAGMQWLTHGLAAGDVLFFYFSGHGAQQPDEDAQEEGVMDETFLPVDFDQEGHISENQVFELLVRKLPSGVRLTMLVDCCLPGICPELPFIYNDEHRTWDVEVNPYHTLGDVVCFSGEPSAMQDISLESLQTIKGLEAGLITTSFLKAIQSLAQSARGPVTYDVLFAEVVKKAEQMEYTCLPRLTATQAFDVATRAFKFSDAICNRNAKVGLSSKRTHRSHR